MVVVGCGSVFSMVVVDFFFSFLLVSMVVIGSIGWCFSGGGDGQVLMVGLSFDSDGCFSWVVWWRFFVFWFGGVSVVVVMVEFQWLG